MPVRAYRGIRLLTATRRYNQCPNAIPSARARHKRVRRESERTRENIFDWELLPSYYYCFFTCANSRTKRRTRVSVTACKNNLLTVMAVNIDTNMPIPKVIAKPLITELPNHVRMPAVMSDEMLESRMEVQARLNPSSTAAVSSFPARNSSLSRSKISTLASTAMPTDKIKPAMPASVSVTDMSLKTVSTNAAYTSKATVAISPGTR